MSRFLYSDLGSLGIFSPSPCLCLCAAFQRDDSLGIPPHPPHPRFPPFLSLPAPVFSLKPCLLLQLLKQPMLLQNYRSRLSLCSSVPLLELARWVWISFTSYILLAVRTSTKSLITYFFTISGSYRGLCALLGDQRTHHH